MKTSIWSYAVVLFLFVGSVFNGMAQDLNYSLRTGLNLSNLAGIDSVDDDEPDKTKAGFHLGGLIDISMPVKGLSVQSGLFWTMKGGASKEQKKDYKYTQKITSHYLQLPIWAAYKYDFGKVAVSGFTGPYIAVGLGGYYKVKYEDRDDEDTFYEIAKYQLFGSKYKSLEYNEKKSDKNTDYYDGGNWGWKRFDVGWSLGAGVTVSRYYLGLQYDWGFINMAREKYKRYAPKNRNFSISVGYAF